MRRRTRKIIWIIFVFLNRAILKCFYDDKYLHGKWFDKSLYGWKWAWAGLYYQKFLGINRHVPWPVSYKQTITKPVRIEFDINDLHIFQSPGCYFQCYSIISIGSGTYIAPNVGLITSNHDTNNLDQHTSPEKVVIGERCWIGMNSVILPGVVLGSRTIVGALSLVNKSFPEGSCLVAGNPAVWKKNI